MLIWTCSFMHGIKKLCECSCDSHSLNQGSLMGIWLWCLFRFSLLRLSIHTFLSYCHIATNVWKQWLQGMVTQIFEGITNPVTTLVWSPYKQLPQDDLVKSLDIISLKNIFWWNVNCGSGIYQLKTIIITMFFKKNLEKCSTIGFWRLLQNYSLMPSLYKSFLSFVGVSPWLIPYLTALSPPSMS